MKAINTKNQSNTDTVSVKKPERLYTIAPLSI